MRILVDENIPLITIKYLRDKGYDILDIRGTPHEGILDESLFNLAVNEKRLLITTDKGFSKKRNELHYGVLIVCLKQPNSKKIQERIASVIEQLKSDEWSGMVVVVRDKVQSIWRTKSNPLLF